MISILFRFKKDLLRQLKLISESLSSVSNGPLPEKKMWIASLSGLSLSALARLELDEAFWRLFLPFMESLDKAGDTDSVKELLIAAQNFTLDSKSLTERGTQISEVCNNEFRNEFLSALNDASYCRY